MQFQIISTQPDQTATFYGELFGWSISPANPMGYREIKTGSSEGIEGGIWPAPPSTSNFAQLFIAVDDIETQASSAQTLGAKLLVPPTPLPDGGAVAILLDPQGMPFALWRRAL
jgi:predicted enzyme related to lactoylglutathione lyase